MLYSNKQLRLNGCGWLLLTGCILLFTFLPSPVMAEERLILTVNTLIDGTDAKPGDGLCETAPGNNICTLRAAIMETNAWSVPDAIILPAGHYHLTIPGPQEDGAVAGDLDISSPLIIQGAGATTTFIDGDGSDRVFNITADQIIVQIEGITIRNGYIIDEPGVALLNRGELYLTGVTFTVHTGLSALQNKGRLTGKEITLFDNYTATALDNLGIMALENSGIYYNNGLGISSYGTMTVVSSTIAYNGTGGVTGDQLTIERSVIERNGGDGINGKGRVTLRQSKIINNTGAGVAVSLSSLTLIEDSLINANGQRGINVEHLLLRRSTVAYNQDGGVKVDGYYFDYNISRIEQSVIHANHTLNRGGGIHNNTKLIITDSAITDNNAHTNGGGIYSAQDLLLTDSTISHNRALTGDGGGIYQDEDPIHLVNSTVSGNTAHGNGGGIASNTLNPQTTLRLGLHSSTIISNTASNSGGLHAPLIGVQMGNTVLAGNLALSAGSSQDCSVQQPLVSLGYNVLGDANDCPVSGISTGNQLGVAPQLGPLQANGGATYTHLPLLGSPVIDAGNPTGCTSFDGVPLFFDQRNYLRQVDGNQDGGARCDIGATEFGDGTPKPAYLPVIVASSSSATLRQLPTTTQVAETGSVVGIGLVIGGALLSALLALLVIEQEEVQGAKNEADAGCAPTGTGS